MQQSHNHSFPNSECTLIPEVCASDPSGNSEYMVYEKSCQLKTSHDRERSRSKQPPDPRPKYVDVQFVGGLLGHWAFWAQKAVSLLGECHVLSAPDIPIPAEMLTRPLQVTDSNAAFFNPGHGFASCIAGIHEMLRHQGPKKGIWCLESGAVLSLGQADDIDRVYAAYPHLNDADFVRDHRDDWLS